MLNQIVLAGIVALPLALIAMGGWRIVWTAVRTGRLQARGTIYDRDSQPTAFYLGVGSWILVFGLLSFISIGVLSHWPSSIN